MRGTSLPPFGRFHASLGVKLVATSAIVAAIVCVLATGDSPQRVLLRAATGVGSAALTVGVVVAWLLGRSFVRRVHTFAQVATAVAAGQTDQTTFPVDGTDEIGVLAEAFNQMLARLHAERSRLRETVEDLWIVEDELETANRELEQRVEQRMLELQTANHRLHDEMTRRTKIELELRQAQKLESVGRLAAGVAHEINTPMQFVSDSVVFARDAVVDLVAVLAAQRAALDAITAGHNAVDLVETAATCANDLDLDYVVAQLPIALVRALDGTVRVANIVRSMKVFAHPDQREMSAVDLNEVITSTFTIAHNEYKYVADAHFDLGMIPAVTCFAGEINQVILNIVVNAAHAIADVVGDSDRRGTISVTTRQAGNFVVISIADTGGGISVMNRDRVFDPFFTTKPVGKGTGQGLAIARGVIVDMHHGALTFDSNFGKGTTFHIRLPLDTVVENAA